MSLRTSLIAAAAVLLAVPSLATAQDFDAVLAAPDDPEVNLAYARQAAAAGDLTGAAGALERILITDPNRHAARLAYAIVLYRLDDHQSAHEQLALLDDVALTPLQRAEADNYRRRIERARTPLRFGGVLASGWTYDQDPAGALSTTLDSFGLAPSADSGISSVLSARLYAFQDLGPTSGLTAFGMLAALDKATFDGPDGDFRRLETEIGLTYQGRLTGWTLAALARRLDIFDTHYMDEVGLRGRAYWRITPALTAGITAEVGEQQFDEPTVDAVAGLIGGDRDGRRLDIGGDLTWRVDGRTSLSIAGGWTEKDADYAPFGYSGPRLQGVATTAFSKGQYISLSGGAQWLDYDAPDLFFVGPFPAREDVRAWGRLAAGAPMSAFNAAGATGDWRQSVTVEAAVTYGARDSGPPLADFDSWGADLRLAWRFGARD